MGVLDANELSLSEIDSLFSNDSNSNDNEETKAEEPEEKTEEKQEEKTTAEEKINPDDLFKPESVGSEENNKVEEGTGTSKDGTSPTNNFYSSIAKALEEEGIFPDLNKDDIDDIKDASDFRDLIDRQIKAGLEERQQRIDNALNVGVEPSLIQQYEKVINDISAISDTQIEEEGEQGENLRKNLIYQDYINRGYSDARARREVDKSFNAGTDIEDAKEALAGNKEFFTSKYDNIIKDAENKRNQEVEKHKKEAEELKKSILNDSKVFGDLELDKKTRQKVYDTIMKPTYKNPDTGEYLTEIEKYQKDNPQEFIKNMGLLFTLTNGFKNIDNLVKGKVKKEVSKGFKNLEEQLSKSMTGTGGNLEFIGRTNKDENSFLAMYDLAK